MRSMLFKISTNVKDIEVGGSITSPTERECFLKLPKECTNFISGSIYEEYVPEDMETTLSDIHILPVDIPAIPLNAFIAWRAKVWLTPELCMRVFTQQDYSLLSPSIFPLFFDTELTGKANIVQSYRNRLKNEDIKRLAEIWHVIRDGQKEILKLGG